MKTKIIAITLSIITLCLSCADDKRDTSLENCSIVISYRNADTNKSMQPTIDRTCSYGSNCHGGGSPHGDYTFYSPDMIDDIERNLFEKEIFLEATMPQEPLVDSLRLTIEELQKFQCWITGGHLEAE